MSNVTKSKNPRSSRFKKKNFKDTAKAADVRQSRKEESMDTSPRTNDLDWYRVNDQLLNDAGNYSFNNPLGNTTRVTELTQFDSSITVSNLNNLDTAIPGIMLFKYIPTIGYSPDSTSPINIAAKALYGVVRSDNSGAKNYEPADMMKYLMALDSAYSMYAFMARIYGLSRVYSVVNRYWPKYIIEAMHVNFNDVMSNNADLRYAINIMAAKLNTLCAPSIMKIFDRHFWMNMGIWKDADFDKSQLYLFAPKYLYYYNEETVPASLSPTDFFPIGTNWTVKNLIDMSEIMTNALFASEDIGIISGDLFKRYGLEGSHKLNSVDEQFEVYPVYDPVVLSQIQNIRCSGDVDINTAHITEITADPDKGALYQVLGNSGLVNPNPGIEVAHMLNIDKELGNITSGDVMEASRLTALGTNVHNTGEEGTNQFVIDVCGSEVVTTMSVFNIDNGALRKLDEMTNFNSGWLNTHTAASSFNMHPAIYDCTVSNTGYAIRSYLPSYDIGNYTVIGKHGLRKLHETALLGLFAVPYFGQYK